MFSIGFLELLLVAIVGLLVLGPDRLPGAVKEASAWINRFRRYANEVRREVEEQVHDMESEAILAEMRDGRRLLDEMQRDVAKAVVKDEPQSAAPAEAPKGKSTPA